VDLDPTAGSEIRKTRPCVVVSTDSLGGLPLRVVVPLTAWRPRHAQFEYRIPVRIDEKNNLSKDSSADPVQVRCVSVERFSSKIGVIDGAQLRDLVLALALMVEAI
jgi:mRNA interferase MazF